MAEKSGKPPPNVIGLKPVPMKLFATWEVDRTPPNCIPRLCSFTLSRLVVLKSLGAELTSITIAVKMQGSKRTLRSNELVLTPNGLLDTELQLNFSLQYPHFLKRDGNKLHIMLQRRKRYKNRTILGYKTLAEGIINMSLVLQRQIDLDLDLLSDSKVNNVIARVTVNSLNSQPVDHDIKQADRTGEFSDEDEELSSNEEGSDSEPAIEDRRPRKPKIPVNARQRNLKQKFISLLKRFRVNEDLQALEAGRETISHKLSGGDMDPADIEDLFEELEDLSDSGPEVDTMSITSTPKPSLRPFFSSSRSLFQGRYHPKNCHASKASYSNASHQTNSEKGGERLSDESSKKADSDSHPENWTDSDPPPPSTSSPLASDEKKEINEKKTRLFTREKNASSGKGKKQSISDKVDVKNMNNNCVVDMTSNNLEMRKGLLEQLGRILGPEDWLPESVVLVNGADAYGCVLTQKLVSSSLRVITTSNAADIKAAVIALVNKIQKCCITSPKPLSVIKLILAGSDGFVNLVLRNYVEQFSYKPVDWQNYIRFLVIPLGTNFLSRYLSSVDSLYGALFVNESWKEALEQNDATELISRISQYLNAAHTVQFPIAEAMITYKEKSSDEESSQIFIPFINDVRVGSSEVVLEIEDGGNSPPRTPPSSPNMSTNFQQRENFEPVELQVDFWSSSSNSTKNSDCKPDNKKNDQVKSTLKTSFKHLQVSRLPAPGDTPSFNFTLSYSTKEKKQKIMRLGKKKEKEKENEIRSVAVDGITRLICSPKTQHAPLKVIIDGADWSGVKFFQLSSQWQTHIRHFPVLLFSEIT
ncbi:phosphofurin acidic cluster sorting protein 2 isoform X2 [Bemisia tabaci]|uniref:phosphofurin acidic cluster sorting protein 2 isoform X2 n=1 Tax=Bemisia tabaci TaxID=7038 RepID=UPI0008F9A965|nr:PREDICTED: phosphofurin acidic cluster sorting protein 2 isoform X2 [Bemisia tabaci]